MNSKFRLGDIEGGDVVGLGAPPGLSTHPGLSAPPRRPQTASQSRTPSDAPARRPQGRQNATSGVSEPIKPATPAPDGELLVPVGESKPTPQRRKNRPGRPTKPQDDSVATRPTNVTVPESLRGKIHAARVERGVSTGELIAIAIETHIAELPDLIADSNRPAHTGMFSTRATRLPRRGDEPERPITYRMTSQDLAVIDNLVESLGARSRGHLIATALRAELATPTTD